MKIIIASDIHGSAFWCEKLCDRIQQEQPDRIILLGDLLYHGPRNELPTGYYPKSVIKLLSEYSPIIMAVRGNCDAEVDQMVLPFPILSETAELYADGVFFFMSHGHHITLESFPGIPAGSVLLTGHTHVKQDIIVNGVRWLNPGSVSIPKDGSNSYLLYEDGQFDFCAL